MKGGLDLRIASRASLAGCDMRLPSMKDALARGSEWAHMDSLTLPLILLFSIDGHTSYLVECGIVVEPGQRPASLHPLCDHTNEDQV